MTPPNDALRQLADQVADEIWHCADGAPGTTYAEVWKQRSREIIGRVLAARQPAPEPPRATLTTFTPMDDGNWHYDYQRDIAVIEGRTYVRATEPTVTVGAPAPFKCKARSANMGANDPQDCDWPVCGCDPYADKVIEALSESGKFLGAIKESVAARTPADLDRQAKK